MRVRFLHLFVLALVAWAAAAELKPLADLGAGGKVILVAKNDASRNLTDTTEHVAGLARWEGR